jgi:hypothetical protein
VGSLSPTSPSEVHNPLDSYLLFEYISECKIIVIRTALASSRRILPLIPAKSYACAGLCSAENVSALFSAASARLQAKHPGVGIPCARFAGGKLHHFCTLSHSSSKMCKILALCFQSLVHSSSPLSHSKICKSFACHSYGKYPGVHPPSPPICTIVPFLRLSARCLPRPVEVSSPPFLCPVSLCALCLCGIPSVRVCYHPAAPLRRFHESSSEAS